MELMEQVLVGEGRVEEAGRMKEKVEIMKKKYEEFLGKIFTLRASTAFCIHVHVYVPHFTFTNIPKKLYYIWYNTTATVSERHL